MQAPRGAFCRRTAGASVAAESGAAVIRALKASLSAWLWSGVPDDIRDTVVDEQTRLVWANAGLASVLASVFSVLMAWHLLPVVDTTLLRWWIVAKLGVSGLRLWQRAAFARQTSLSAPWVRLTLVMLALDAVVWGVGGASLMAETESLASLVAATLACVACVATFGLQLSLPATMAYVLPMLLPTAAGLASRGDEFGGLGCIGLLLLLLVQLAAARRGQARLAAGIALRLHAERLAEDKDAALGLALRQSAVKSQFLGNVSHELRTPLHGILGLARLIHLETDENLVRQRIELIEASGRHLLTLINDLIDVARIEAGRFPLRDEVFDLATQLQQVADVHAVRAEDKGLAFALDSDIATPCWVHGDPGRFRQVLYNLLGNAIKFTREGHVRLLARRADDGMVTVVVEDTGPGISAQDRERIFEAFQQATGAVSDPLEGAGLGLKIARELALAMQGQLGVESRAEGGSSFRFTARLPAAEPPALPDRALLALGVTRGQRPLRVLVAEDDEVNALIAVASLERLGVQVERVADGRQAVRHALREVDRPDLVLMDCRMPVLDGYSATREIRAQEFLLGLHRLPIIALTATVTDLGRVQCMEAGMDDFIAKPYSPQQLEAALHGWLGEAPVGARPGAGASDLDNAGR